MTSITQAPPRTWNIVTQFLHSEDDRWLDDFIDDPRLQFRRVIAARRLVDWHERGDATPPGEWGAHLRQALAAFSNRPSGIVTCFPQLALCVSALKLARFDLNTKLVAQNFNIGDISNRAKGRVSGALLRGVDRFIVHSRAEIDAYSDWLGIDRNRFVFVPLQRGETGIVRREDEASPFVLAMGSAGRDYRSLIEAVDSLGVRTIIVTKEDIVKTLPSSEHVAFRSGLSARECYELLAQARLSVTPLDNLATASGQVTFVAAMNLGVPTLATAAPGTEDYIEHMKTGVLLAPRSAADMREKIALLWNNPSLRREIGEGGRRQATLHYSDEAAAEALKNILLDVGEERADPVRQPVETSLPRESAPGRR